MTERGRRLPVVRGVADRSLPGFQRIAVIGLGAIGASLGLAIRQAWPDALVIGVDTSTTVETAVRMHAIDLGADDLVVASDADLIVLAGGPAENARAVPFLADAVAGEAIVLALGEGLAVAAARRALPDRLSLVIGIPVLTRPGHGIRAARSDLFRGHQWTLTAGTGPAASVERVAALVRAVGGVVAAPAPPAQRTG